MGFQKKTYIYCPQSECPPVRRTNSAPNLITFQFFHNDYPYGYKNLKLKKKHFQNQNLIRKSKSEMQKYILKKFIKFRNIFWKYKSKNVFQKIFFYPHTRFI